MNLINEIRDAWNWKGLEPVAVIAENDFGNVLVEDANGSFWRICPEECSCERVASDRVELERLFAKRVFLEDWHMHNVVAIARESCGELTDGKKYSLKIPAFLGGAYSAENYAIVPFTQLIAFSGDLAEQTKDLPDGAQVSLKIVNSPPEG